MAKKNSKRVSERRKTKTAIKNARKEAKLKRELRKKQKNTIKVPRDYLMTDEEKELIKKIKDDSKKRSALSSTEIDNDPTILELKSCVFDKNCDAFIEVVDFRDIESSRSKICEDFLKKNFKKIFMFINYVDDKFDMDYSSIKNDNIEIINGTDILPFKNFKKICIFGNRKSGKFLLSKNINSEADFEFIRVPSGNNVISDLFRGLIELKDVDPVNIFEVCWKFINKDQIRERYEIGRFDSSGSFLDLLAEKLSKNSIKKKSHTDAAIYFFKEVISGKIRWVRNDNVIYFDLLN